MCRLTAIMVVFSILTLFADDSLAQDASIITADNIEQLTSVRVIDFDRLPAHAGDILNGRVYINGDGTVLAVVNREGQVVVLDDGGDVLDVSAVILTGDGFPATFIDGVFADDGTMFASIHTAGDRYFVSFMTVAHDVSLVEVKSDHKPVTIWLDDDLAWLEVVPSDSGNLPYLLQVPIPTGSQAHLLSSVNSETDFATFPFAPAEDTDAVVRIGRLPPPLAVTVTENGQVKRWDLETGALTGLSEVELLPVYGYMTPDGRWLLWRDPASMTLNLLDFTMNDDRMIFALDSVYIPFLFLTSGADVAIGVFPNDEATIIAWDTASGNQHELGLFRQCQRPPDMVRLSLDNTMLVVGCDAGLDIWRVGT